MSAFGCNSHGSKVEIARRLPSSGRELTLRHALTLTVPSAATARFQRSPFQSAEDLHDSGLTS